MKKLSKLLLVFALLFTIMPTTVHASNDSGELGNLKWQYVESSKFLGIWGDASIPAMPSLNKADDYPWAKYKDVVETIEFKLVSKVGDHAFEGFTNLKMVYIPGPMRELGKECFYSCEELSTVTIKEGLTTIGESCFMWCSKLNDIKLPETLTSIGIAAFKGCGFANINIPSNVKTIEDSAFSNCNKLTKVTVPKNVTSLGSAFSSCENLTDLIIEASITTIDEDLCFENFNLKNVVFPDNVKKIGEYAFYDCDSLNASIPDGVETIGQLAFYFYRKSGKIYVPKSVKSIGIYALGYYLDGENEAHIKNPGYTIYGISGTAAEKYAKKNGFKFVNHTSHNWNSGKTVKSSTCTTKGIKLYTCTTCGHQKKESVALHTFNIYDKCTKCGTMASYIDASVPKMTVKSISKAKGALTVKWKKNTKVKGYEIRYSTKSGMSGAKTVKITKNKTTSKKIKNLKKKTTYYVQIRAYKSIGGKTKYSPWSAVKSAKTK